QRERKVVRALHEIDLLDFGDLGAQRDQPADQLTVAALDRLERRYARLTFGREAGRYQRHSRSEIATIEDATPSQSRGAIDDDAVRVGEEHVGAHAAQLLEREESQLVHPVVDERAPVGLRRQDGHEADQVAWESRP